MDLLPPRYVIVAQNRFVGIGTIVAITSMRSAQ